MNKKNLGKCQYLIRSVLSQEANAESHRSYIQICSNNFGEDNELFLDLLQQSVKSVYFKEGRKLLLHIFLIKRN